MPPFISLCLLALALSIDNFGVGAMYGLRTIRIPLLSVLIIASCSGFIFYISMQIGFVIAHVVSPAAAKIAGAAILILIGIWTLIHMVMQSNDEPSGALPVISTLSETESSSEKMRALVRIEFKRLGLVIQILKTPSMADVDRSGVISSSEATLLGIALSLDAFGAGIGAALIGFSPITTAAVIAMASGLFIILGLRAGFLFSQIHWIRKLTILPGCILILMGIMRLL